MKNEGKRYTSAGTDIEQVKRQNAQANNAASGSSMTEFGQEASFSSGKSPGKTVADTDIAEVKRQNANPSKKS